MNVDQSFSMYTSADGVGQGFVMRPFIGMVYTIEAYIGIIIPGNKGLLDTGAQHGVIGLPALNRLESELRKHGLKPRVIRDFSK